MAVAAHFFGLSVVDHPTDPHGNNTSRKTILRF